MNTSPINEHVHTLHSWLNMTNKTSFRQYQIDCTYIFSKQQKAEIEFSREGGYELK